MVFRLDFRQISFNLVENAFASRTLAILATSVTFYDILAQACAEIKILRVFGGESDLCPKVFRFFNVFYRLSFFSFSLLFAVVIDLLMGLLGSLR